MEMPIIKISNFDGPFDLLLHLIKKNEMKIEEIKIQEITKQYLKYIHMMKELDLEITSEFIVMAATLIEIKSKSLLPKEINENEESEKDLTLELMNKLIEYKKFKKIAEYLRGKESIIGEVFTKKPEIIEENIKVEENNNDFLNHMTMLDLYYVYNKLMEIYREKKNDTNVIEKKISVDKYKIEDKMCKIKEELKNTSVVKFSEFVYQCECKLEVVVTFLALLELIKDSYLKVLQYDNLGEIIIEKVIRDE